MAKTGIANKKSKDDFFSKHNSPNSKEGSPVKDLLPGLKKGGKKPSKPSPSI